MDTGVPQGSVLGPLLFSLFVNNLPAQLQGVTTVLFADDTSLYIAGRSTDDISNTLTRALGSAHKWFLDSGLKLNVSKTKCMLISSNRRKSLLALNVQLDGVCIEQVCTYKFLGVMVNQSLSWSNHIDLVSSRASKGLNLLRRIAWFLPKNVLCCFYKGYILPQLTYADTVWGSCTRAESDRLERLQNYAARIILGRRRDASATAMRCELGWPTLASRRALAELQMVYRCVTGCAPQYLVSLFVRNTDIHLHNTRAAASGGIHVPKVRSEFGKKSFAFRGCQRWNALPPFMRTIKNPTTFMTTARSNLLTYTT